MVEGATNEAKGKLYAKKMEGSSFDDIAAAVSETVKTGRDVSIKFPTVRGKGASAEPKVAGAAFATPIGEVSAPIVGNYGFSYLPVCDRCRRERQLLGRTKHAGLTGTHELPVHSVECDAEGCGCRRQPPPTELIDG